MSAVAERDVFDAAFKAVEADFVGGDAAKTLGLSFREALHVRWRCWS